MERSTWVEVRTSALRSNFAAVARHASVPVIAVVKANGYGHDATIAARAFVRAGATMLAVTRLEEAQALRAAGIDAPILIMVPVPDPGEAVRLGCAITVGSQDEIASLPSGARVHLKMDTGMGRLGVAPSNVLEAARAIAATATLDAVWTHFADAASPDGRVQLQRFASVLPALRHAGLAVQAHAANSPATLTLLPDAAFDAVRVGTLLYGQHPPGAQAPWPLEETLTWFARVAEVRTVAAGATVGYGSEWTAKNPTRIATIPVGYADGFGVEIDARTPSLGGSSKLAAKQLLGRRRFPRAVFFADREAPVVGRISMQVTTVSLEGHDDVVAGSVARIPAARLTIDPTIERVEVP